MFDKTNRFDLSRLQLFKERECFFSTEEVIFIPKTKERISRNKEDFGMLDLFFFFLLFAWDLNLFLSANAGI